MITEILRRSNELVKSVYDDFREFISPSLCPGCRGELSPESQYFCPNCLNYLRKLPGGGPACPFCGRPAGVPGSCTFCSNPGSIRLFFWSGYNGLLKDCVLLFKFKGVVDLGRELTDLAAGSLDSRIRSLKFDLIVPVPLYRARKRKREFNQSEIIAGALAKRFEIEKNDNILIRVRQTAQQAKLAENHRWENVKGAFALKENIDLSGRRILLVDDIVTTGATIHEASLPLKNAGAEVTVFSLAYAV